MAAQLIKEVHTYEVETKTQAEELIRDFESKSDGMVTYKLTHRTKKSGGEVEFEWYVVEITQKYKM
jgi:hypothetical protein